MGSLPKAGFHRAFLGSKSAITNFKKAGIQGGYQSTNSFSPDWYALDSEPIAWNGCRI